MSTLTLEHKTFSGMSTKVVDDSQGVVEAIVAVTGNIDDGNDLIEPGAFAFPAGRLPKVVWSHDLNVLVGKVLEAAELRAGDTRLPADFAAKGWGGLWFKTQFDLADVDGQKAYRKVSFHDDLGWSIGYEVPPDGFKIDKSGIRHLTKVVVWEGSPTTFGMNAAAQTLSVKSMAEAKSDPPIAGSFEERQRMLRAALDMWAVETLGERTDENHWWAWIDSTFADRLIARVERGDSEPTYYLFGYTSVDGAVELAPPVEVELTTVINESSGDQTSRDLIEASRSGPEEAKSVGEPDEKADDDAVEAGIEPLSIAELLEFEALSAV